jgi:hypothetical protein
VKAFEAPVLSTHHDPVPFVVEATTVHAAAVAAHEIDPDGTLPVILVIIGPVPVAAKMFVGVAAQFAVLTAE